MTLAQIILLFESVERGEFGQVIDINLHDAIAHAADQSWPTHQRRGDSFSDFLKALRDAEPPQLKQGSAEGGS